VPRSIYLESQDGWLTAGAAPLTAVVAGGLKFIALPEPELYDLAVDPGETHNLLPDSADRARPLAAALRTMTANTTATGATPQDREAEARLRSLGYASAGPRAIPTAFGPHDDPKVVRPMYENFLTLLAAGAPDVGALRALVEARPSFEAARLAAASLLIDQGRAVEAVVLLEPAAAAPGASSAVRERLGAALLGASRFDRAVAVLTSVVDDGQASADAWNALGVGLATLGRHREAVAALDQAIILAPSAARMRFNRALAHLADGDRAAARRDASDAAVAQPSLVDAWRLRATLDHEGGDRAAAVEAWQRVVALAPGDLDTYFNLAVTLRDLGRIDDARVMARKYAELAPRPAASRELGILAPLLQH
jgi:Flp pilus assembly protein TadD